MAGLVFVVLLIVIASMTLGAPKPDESAGSTLAWYAGHRGTALVAVLLSSLAAGVFLWFVAHLRDRVARASTTGGVTGALALSGTAIAVTAATGTASTYVLTMLANRPEVTPDPSLVRLVNDLGSVWFGFLAIFTGVFLLALALAFFDGAVGSRKGGWIALPAGILAVVAGSLYFFPDTHGKPMAATFLAVFGFVGFLLVIVLASIGMLRTERAAVRAQPAQN